MKCNTKFEQGAVARSDARLPGMRTVAGSILTSGDIPSWRLVISISTTILSLPLIQESWLVVLRLNVPVNNFSVISGRSHRFLGN